jgi:UDP-N-acetylglucosamine 2-epimerase (non-hydrolysing)
MKIATILGTRPEIIRLSLIIPKLDRWAERHILIHTGQNYDPRLSDIFFESLKLRAPDYHIDSSHDTLGGQLGRMFSEVEQILLREKPDRVLLLGDTNSALCALLAERMGIPVYHMEAGNRCFDPKVPEELNRRMIDAVCSVNLPYTTISRNHLMREGKPPQRVHLTGNPIYEVIERYRSEIQRVRPLESFGLKPKQYMVVTAHRAENVDPPQRLRSLLEGLDRVAEQFACPVLVSLHPRTRDHMKRHGLTTRHPSVRYSHPFNFFEFIHLQQHARCVLTDSGTVQEESCILGVPSVTIRDSTERPETIECGSNTLAGVNPEAIRSAVRRMADRRGDWAPPVEYLDPLVSDKVVNLVLGGGTHV